ncbi:MAG TPA: lipocalin family protein [Candidatus Nitrosotenuis sp.]|nr:lipocalin family protein [Candidatus Nitrosotenuis sp.]
MLKKIAPGPPSARPGPPPRPAVPGDPRDSVEFPRDEGAHFGVKTEWWYLNGHLRDAQGRRYGFHHALFDMPDAVDGRYNVDLPGMPGVVALDTGLTEEGAGRHSRSREMKVLPPGWSHPGLKEGRLDVQFRGSDGTWRLRRWSTGSLHVSGPTGRGHLNLEMEPVKPPLLMGGQGEIAMGPYGRSKYYTLPRLQARGSLTLDGEVRPVEGEVWLDHQWGDMQIFNGYAGWDWFGLQMADGTDINAFRFRDRQGGTVQATVGISRPDGSQAVSEKLELTPGRTWKSGETAVEYPLEWHLAVPDQGVDLRLRPTVDGQEMVGSPPRCYPELALKPTYWEGSVEVEGTVEGRPVQGRGFLELTGYADEHRAHLEPATVELARRLGEEARAACSEGDPPPARMDP